MSRMGDYYLCKVEVLSKVTGYDFDFLWKIFNEVMDEDGDYNYFEAVTLEKDW